MSRANPHTLARMEAKLARLETEMDAAVGATLGQNHGGSPTVDNSKGRQQRRALDAQQERMMNKARAIAQQKEAVEDYRLRLAGTPSGPTKASQTFLEQHPIHPGLLALAEQGLVKQWERSPEYFFVAGMKRVALVTVDGRVGRASRFPPVTEEDRAESKRLMDLANAHS